MEANSLLNGKKASSGPLWRLASVGKEIERMNESINAFLYHISRAWNEEPATLAKEAYRAEH